MRTSAGRYHSVTRLTPAKRSRKALQSDVLHVVASVTAGHDSVWLSMTSTAKQAAVPPRLPKQLARFFGVSGAVTESGPAGRFLQPWFTTAAYTLAYLGHGAMTGLADKAMLGLHNVAQALGVGAGMTLVAVVSELAMFLMHDF